MNNADLKHRVETLLHEAENSEVYTLKVQKALRWIIRQTATRTNHSQMLVGELEGKFLHLFVKKYIQNKIEELSEIVGDESQIKSIKILEIGTFTGYSLLSLASAMLPFIEEYKNIEFKVEAFEINDELEYIINEGLSRGGVNHLVKVAYGDAKDLLKNIIAIQNDTNKVTEGGFGEYDIVFIDANKREYLDYYKLVKPLLKSKGFILADNVLWYGKTTDDNQNLDLKTAGILKLVNTIKEESSQGVIESFLLPIRDGVYVIKKVL